MAEIGHVDIEFRTASSMKYFSLLVCFLLLVVVSSNAQNLIRNSSFDSYSTYIDSNNHFIYQPQYWYHKNIPSHPIYYSSDRFLNDTLPNSFHPDAALINQGFRLNYISVLILPDPQRTYTSLAEPLKKGQRYKLKVDIKALDQSNYLSDLLVGFKDCMNGNMDSCLYQLKLSIPDSLCNDALFDKWITLSADFTAKGNETVFVISAGSPEDYLKIVNSNLDKYRIRLFQGPFRLKYFIDNVILTPANDGLPANEFDSLRVGESIVLHNIYFNFDRYELLPESYSALDKVAAYLVQHNTIQLLISGHTDNVGSDEYNHILSDNRAKAVVDYLVGKGIAKERLQWEGLGSTFPIESNNTEAGRQVNRRIEMKIVKR